MKPGFMQDQQRTLNAFRTKNPRKRRNMRNRSYNRNSSGWGIGALIAIVIVAVIALCVWGFYTTQVQTSKVTFTVASKERIAEQNSGKYLVFTTDDEAFQVTDNILYGKTDSSNRYAALDEGTTYECTAVGVRFSLFSLYKNLIECEEVN